MSGVEVIRADLLAGIAHGFLGRRGGVSTGICGGLNVGLGSDDDAATVAENRRLAAAAVLPGALLLTPYQYHSTDAVTVLAAYDEGLRPRADALVTDRPRLLIGVVTADCAPVLLADRDAGVVAAAHVGWKGAIGGITDSTILAMEAIGARRERIVAAIGPCIAQSSYQVDDAFRGRFVADDPANARHFAADAPGHHRFDLAGYVAARLDAAAVRRVETIGLDTCADEERFFSYRRATQRGESSYGRQIALIGIE